MTPASSTYAPEHVAAIRRSRRHPRPTQFDYLHLRALVDGLARAVAAVPGPVRDVLDIWCGSRPYEDLLPRGARCVGLDVTDNPYGVADVVSDDFLPFPDASFDLVTFIEAFQYVPDPGAALEEIRRVLRPGGTAVLGVVFAFEYDREHFETRYTQHQLTDLLAGWDEVRVTEDGGRAVSWAVLTGSLLHGLEQRLGRRAWQRPLRLAFPPIYALVNGVGRLAARGERGSDGRAALPMHLTVTARKPVDG
jgi:SAM-dependent methyltransferase